MKKLSLHDIELEGKKVLMRVDFNVPMNEDGTIADETRIKLSMPSIQYVLSQGARLILMSHLGRPKGERNPKYSLQPCAGALQKHLGKPVLFASDCIGSDVEAQVSKLANGQVILLENLRFYKEEEHPDDSHKFAKELAKLGDVYVNDAFATAHRKHSSTAIIAEEFPEKAACGFLMEKEYSHLSKILLNPRRPFHAIIGGAKISTKIGVLKSLLQKIDSIFIGGGMAYTFLKAQGHSIGDSICDDQYLDEAKSFMSQCSEKAIQCYLPKDLVITKEISDQAEYKTVLVKEGIPEGWEGVDIGEKTVEEWSSFLKNAGTVFWNGPVGVFEVPSFAKGTQSIAEILSECNGITIAGGGDSVAAINQLGFSKNFTHISSGGGASLEFIQYGHLPGIDALSNR